MIARATTTVSVLRGETTDGYGDAVAGTTAVATGIPASIMESSAPGGGISQRVTTSDDPDPRIVRSYLCRLPSGTDIRDDDRLQDERTGTIYLIDSTDDASNPIRQTDMRLALRRTT